MNDDMCPSTILMNTFQKIWGRVIFLSYIKSDGFKIIRLRNEIRIWLWIGNWKVTELALFYFDWTHLHQNLYQNPCNVCLSVLYFNSLPMNQFESQIYLWNSLNMVDILRLFKSDKNWNKKLVFIFEKNFHPSHSRRANEAPRRGVIREFL